MADLESSTKKDKQEDREMEEGGWELARLSILYISSHHSFWLKTIPSKYSTENT